MSTITIEIHSEKLTALLARLARGVEDLTPVMGDVGDALLRHIRDCFEGSTDPVDNPWKPLKQRKGKPLVDTGALVRSVVRRAVTANSVTVGTKLAYAAVQNFGGKAGRNHATTIPARPFMPTATLPVAWEHEISLIITRHLGRIIEATS